MKCLTAITSLLVLVVFPTAITAAIGGRCTGEFNDDGCICLDHNDCTNLYAGSPVQGIGTALACPFDTTNVWGCYITDHCPTKTIITWCRWKEACPRPVRGGKFSVPLSPFLFFHIFD